MKNLNNYFDEAKAITGSDRQTAIKIGVTPNRISMARKDGVMSNEFCTKLAEIIDTNPIHIIAAAEVKKHPEKESFWGKWAMTASVILTVGAMTQAPDLKVNSISSTFDESIHYAQFGLKGLRN